MRSRKYVVYRGSSSGWGAWGGLGSSPLSKKRTRKALDVFDGKIIKPQEEKDYGAGRGKIHVERLAQLTEKLEWDE